jgi:hypothetical protein
MLRRTDEVLPLVKVVSPVLSHKSSSTFLNFSIAQQSDDLRKVIVLTATTYEGESPCCSVMYLVQIWHRRCLSVALGRKVRVWVVPLIHGSS